MLAEGRTSGLASSLLAIQTWVAGAYAKAKGKRQKRAGPSSIEPQILSPHRHHVSHHSTPCFDSAGSVEFCLRLCSAWRSIARSVVSSLRNRAAGAKTKPNSNERTPASPLAGIAQLFAGYAIGTRNRNEGYLATSTGLTGRRHRASSWTKKSTMVEQPEVSVTLDAPRTDAMLVARVGAPRLTLRLVSDHHPPGPPFARWGNKAGDVPDPGGKTAEKMSPQSSVRRGEGLAEMRRKLPTFSPIFPAGRSGHSKETKSWRNGRYGDRTPAPAEGGAKEGKRQKEKGKSIVACAWLEQVIR